MKKIEYFLAIAICMAMLIACKSNTAPTAENSSPTEMSSPSTTSSDEYFTFAIDGKEMSIAAADISTSFSSFDSTFKVFAGADKKLSIVLTIPALTNCPCSVPAGSAEAGNQLDQGSVALQNYPQTGYGFNSWSNSMHDAPPAEAIKITDLGTVKDGYRFITGEFHAKVLKTESNGDKPDNKDYEITNGKFRVKHDTHGSNSF